MATRTLPNPAFGNDPATLLGSLIVEINDLQKDQKETTKRIENLDENEDQSTTMIEKAIYKETDAIKDTTSAIGELKNLSLEQIKEIKTITEEQRQQLIEQYKGTRETAELMKDYMKNVSFKDKIGQLASDNLMKLSNYFDTRNPDGIMKIADSLKSSTMNFVSGGVDSGVDQVKEGFANLTDGMGALGPVVNAVKTTFSKAKGVFDIFVGSFRAVGDFAGKIGGMFKGLGTTETPEDAIAKAIESGEMRVEDSSDISGGSSDEVILADSVYDRFRTTIRDALPALDERDDFERYKDELREEEAMNLQTLEQQEEQTEILEDLLDEDKKENKSAGIRSKASMGMLAGVIAILLGLGASISNVFSGNITSLGAFIINGIGALMKGGTIQAAMATAKAAAANQKLISSAGNTVATSTSIPLKSTEDILKTNQEIMRNNPDKRTKIYKAAQRTVQAILTGGPVQTELDLDAVATSDTKTKGNSARLKRFFGNAFRVGAPIAVVGLDAFIGMGTVDDKIEALQSTLIYDQESNTMIPSPKLHYIFPGEPIPRPMTGDEYDTLMSIFNAEKAGEIAGATAGGLGAFGTFFARAKLASAPFSFSIPGAISFGLTSLGAAGVSYFADTYADDAITKIYGGLMNDLSEEDFIKFQDMLEIVPFEEIKNKVDEMNDTKDDFVGPKRETNLQSFNSINPFIHDTTMNIYGKDPIDNHIRQSEHIHSLYG